MKKLSPNLSKFKLTTLVSIIVVIAGALAILGVEVSSASNPSHPLDHFATAEHAMWPTGSNFISESQAIANAQVEALPTSAPHFVQGESPQLARASIPSNAQFTNYGEAARLIKESANPGIDTSLPVWMVTVHGEYAFGTGQMAPSAGEASVYTVIMDAVNGNSIDVCMGCATVSPSNTTTSMVTSTSTVNPKLRQAG